MSRMKGETHYNWNGGRRIDHRGYVLIYKPDHPHTQGGLYVPEHRLVMEQYLGRYLKPTELVHHINEIKTDNRIENLQKTTRKRHPKFHPKPRINMSDRKCSNCGSKETSSFGNDWKMWHKVNDGFSCNRCWQRIYHKEWVHSKLAGLS